MTPDCGSEGGKGWDPVPSLQAGQVPSLQPRLLPWPCALRPSWEICKEFSVQISLRHDTVSKAETGSAGAEILWASWEFPPSSWRKQHLYLPPKSHEASFKHQSSTVAVPSLQQRQTQHTHPRAAAVVTAGQPHQLGLLKCSDTATPDRIPLRGVKSCL